MTSATDELRDVRLPGALAASRRRDAWWIQPALTVAVLGGFVGYGLWVTFVNKDYYARPYLSPFYSPCLAANCEHHTWQIVGSWWNLSPALLILPFPLGFRLTCYYYRKAYYRAFFWSPPACAVPDARPRFSGETVFPFLLQNIHRYFFWLALIVLAFLWWDTLLGFRFPNGLGVGLGSLVLLANVGLLSLYSW